MFELIHFQIVVAVPSLHQYYFESILGWDGKNSSRLLTLLICLNSRETGGPQK